MSSGALILGLESKDVVLLVVGAVVSAALAWLIAAYYFYSQFRQLRPYWAVRSAGVARAGLWSGLEVSFKGRQVPTASISHVAFWNSGRKEMLSSDVGPIDLLAIRVKTGVEILDVTVLEQPNENNVFQPEPYDSRAERVIQFHYVGSGEGVVLNVLHTGTTTDSIALTGTSTARSFNKSIRQVCHQITCRHS